MNAEYVAAKVEALKDSVSPPRISPRIDDDWIVILMRDDEMKKPLNGL